MREPYVQAAAMARVLGGQVEVPGWDELRADLDEILAAPPKRLTEQERKQLVMMQAIGLREV